MTESHAPKCPSMRTKSQRICSSAYSLRAAQLASCRLSSLSTRAYRLHGEERINEADHPLLHLLTSQGGNMVGPHDYTRGTMTALITLARGTCYYPNCSTPLFLIVGGKPQPNFMTAHIRAASPNGPRYFKEMSDDERRQFPNLVLLCLAHHNTVDGQDRDKYTIALLERWKSDRQAASLAELKGLREVTEDRLQEMITGALE